nr:hypothetical protein [Tanacetum cinerariifolium]
EDASKQGGKIEAINTNEDITLVDAEKDEEVQERHLDNIRKYQNLKKKPVLIAQARKNMMIYLKNMARYKIEHFRGMTYDKVRPIFEREYKKVQTLFKPDKDVKEPKKKRVADETLLQESFKKLRTAEVSGSESTQEIPSNDPKEMSKEDVQNISAKPSEGKEKALWVELIRLFEPDAYDVLWKLQRYMHALLTWKLYTNCGVHHVSSTRGHDIFMLTEKDYPLSNVVMILMLSGKLQVKKDNEMARDLVMKIFMEANKPKSKSSDTSSKKFTKGLMLLVPVLLLLKIHKGINAAGSSITAAGSRLMLLDKVDTGAEVLKNLL